MKTTITASKKKLYENIIEEAAIDCKDEEEQIMGWECTFDENIKTPCPCKIGKEPAILERITSDENGSAIIGVIKLNKSKMRILIQDIILEDSEAMNCINAYKQWCNGNY